MPLPHPSRLHALLIGIDAYLGPVTPLHGCVNDVNAVHDMLRDRVAALASVRRLTAPHPGAPSTPDVPDCMPTSKNLRQAFVELADEVQPGDRVLIFYSGHGTQVTLKLGNEPRFTREAIVPVDARESEQTPRYIFDWELSCWLRELAQRAHIVVVLDCCSAAGLTRSASQPADGEARFCPSAAPLDIEIAPAASPRGLAEGLADDGVATVLAACLDDERAIESGAGVERCGVLTRGWLAALSEVEDAELAMLRWSRIWRSVQSYVAARSPGQHPWLSAHLGSLVFGGPAVPGDSGYALTWQEPGAVKVHAGTRAGVGPGAELAVYAAEPPRLAPVGSQLEREQRYGTLRVIAASDHAADATIVDGCASPIADARGRLIAAAADDKLVISVPPGADLLAQEISSSGLLCAAAAGQRADAELVLRPDGTWALIDEIYGESASAGPALPACGELAAAVRLAAHYACFIAPVRLARRCSDAPGALRVTLIDAAEGHPPDELEALGAGLPDDDAGARFFLRIENRSNEALFVSVLDCDSDGAVSLLHDRVHVPARGCAESWHPRGTGQPFRAALEHGQSHGIDRFVCIGSTDRGARFEHLVTYETFATAAARLRRVSLATPRRTPPPTYAAAIATARLTPLGAGANPHRPLRDELGPGLAIVIGIDAYGGGWQLNNAKADATAIGDKLAGEHRFTVERYPDATLAQLQTLCKQLPERVRQYGQVVIYFAGHGLAEAGDDGNLQGWLAPSDAQFGDVQSLLAMPLLRQACEDSAAAPPSAPEPAGARKRHVLLLLDCCAAGALGTRQARAPGARLLYRQRYARLLAQRGVQFIGAADHQQAAGESMQRAIDRRAAVDDHSPFASAVLEALTLAGGDGRGHPVDSNHDGVFLASELHDYLREALYRWNTRLPENLRQTPVYYTLGGHEGGDMVFAASHREVLPDPDSALLRASPYRGGSSYQDSVEDERVFFGREAALAALEDHVSRCPLTIVTGASRSGKTSLLRAGLARRRRAAGWEVRELALGASPPEPPEPGCVGRLFVVDEIPSDDAAARAFISQLEVLAQYACDRVVATMRDDRAAAAASALASWRTWPLPAMGHDELRAAIEGPAEVSVVFFEHRAGRSLVDALIDRLVHQPAAPALLSVALDTMFRRQQHMRDDRTLRWADYEAVGEIHRDVRDRAEALISRSDGAVLLRMLIRLIEARGPDAAPRALAWGDVGGLDREPRFVVALDRLVAERLVVRGRLIELGHDAVIEAPPIASLISGHREALRIHADLADAAAARVHELWGFRSLNEVRQRLDARAPTMTRRLGDVLRPARLAQDIEARIPVVMSEAEQAFLRASARRRSWQTLLRVGVPMTLLIGTVILLFVIRAETEARGQQARLGELNAVREAASLVRQDPRAVATAIDRALSALRADADVGHAPELMQALLEVASAGASLPSRVVTQRGQVLALIAHDQRIVEIVHRGDGLIVADAGEDATPFVQPVPDLAMVALSPKGAWAAYAVRDTLQLWNVAAHRWEGAPITLRGAGESPATVFQPLQIAFSGDERRVAMSFDGPGLRIGVWEVGSHAMVGRLLEVDGSSMLSTDQAGRHLVAGAAQPNCGLRLIDLASGTEIELPHATERCGSVAAFSPDDKHLAIGGSRGVGVWALEGASAFPLTRLRSSRGNIASLAFAADGARLAASTIEGDAIVWTFPDDGPADAAVRYLVGNGAGSETQGPISPIVFGADFVAALAQNGSDVVVWRREAPIALELPHSQPVMSLAVSPSGRWLVTGAVDRVTRIWDARTGSLLHHGDRPQSVTAVAATDTWVAAGCADNTVELMNSDGGHRGATITQRSAIRVVALSPNGRIASASDDGTIVVADSEGGNQVMFAHGKTKPGDGASSDRPETAIHAIVWLGADRIASAGQDGFVRLWQVEPNRKPVELASYFHGSPVLSLAWSAANADLVATGADGAVARWQTETGQQTRLTGHLGPVVSAQVSPDGSKLVTASTDGTAKLWSMVDGHVIATYRGSDKAMRDAAFAPGDVGRVVTQSDDGLLQVWSEEGVEQSRVMAHSGAAGGRLIFIGADRVATGGEDGFVRVFPLSVTTVIRSLCELRARKASTEPEDRACVSIKKR